MMRLITHKFIFQLEKAAVCHKTLEVKDCEIIELCYAA